MTRAVIYTRFSPRPDADECMSNERQEERCRKYCDARGYEIQQWCFDRSVSGKVLHRRGLSEALNQLAPGMILVVDSSDRLARDILVNLTIRAQVSAVGCTIEFADGSPHADTAEGELFQNLMAAFAQYERRRYSNRTKAGMARKRESGVWCGRPPIGWRKLPGTNSLIKDQEEQVAIRYANTLRYANALGQNGVSSSAIAKMLNEIHGPCRGRPWSARTVRRILARKLEVSS